MILQKQLIEKSPDLEYEFQKLKSKYWTGDIKISDFNKPFIAEIGNDGPKEYILRGIIAGVKSESGVFWSLCSKTKKFIFHSARFFSQQIASIRGIDYYLERLPYEKFRFRQLNFSTCLGLREEYLGSKFERDGVTYTFVGVNVSALTRAFLYYNHQKNTLFIGDKYFLLESKSFSEIKKRI